MKNTAKRFLVIAPLLGLFTVSCGDNFDKSQDAGQICVYAGAIYNVGQTWIKDGCNTCVCGPLLKVSCTLTCDGGASDGARASDAKGDLSSFSDSLEPSDALADTTSDAKSLDVPLSSDTKPVDSPVASDTRLASERD